MKRARLVLCMAVAAVFIFSATPLVLAAQQAPNVITIKPSIWQKFTKPFVTFNHKKHVTEDKIACNQCHMIYKNGKNVWKEGDPVERCEKCHNEPTTHEEYKLTPAQKKLNLKLAYHNLCLTCHRKVKNQHPTTKAPIVCTGCHKPAQSK